MLYELDESAPDKCSGYHEARTAGKFPGGELAVRSLGRRLARQFSNPLGNAEPKRPEPFLLYVRAESAPGVRRFEKNEGPNSALDLAALFTQVFHVAILSRGEAQAFALADGISNVWDGNQHGQELSSRVGMNALVGPGGSREPRARAVREGSHIGQDRDGWRCSGIRGSQRLVRRARPFGNSASVWASGKTN